MLIQINIWISNLSKPGALIITRDGETAFVGPYARLSTVEVSALVDELRPWDPKRRNGMPGVYPEAIHDVLTSKRINKGSVGMEIGPEMRVHLSYDDFTDLMGRMTAYEIVDAGSAIWPLRMVKSPQEIERLRQACAINSTAFERAIRSIHPGMTEMALPPCYADRSAHADQYRSPGWSGHGIGLTVHEPPMIQLGNREPLQAGMVLAIEPDFYEEGVGVFGIERNILVTDDGYDLLSPADHDLWVLEA